MKKNIKNSVGLLISIALLTFAVSPEASAEGEQPYTNTYSVDWIAMDAPAVGHTISEAVQSLNSTFFERVSFMAEGTGVRDNIELSFDSEAMERALGLVLAEFSIETDTVKLSHRSLSAEDCRLLGYLYWKAFDANITVTETYSPTGEYAADGSAVYDTSVSEQICLNCADYVTFARRLSMTASEREAMVNLFEQEDYSAFFRDNLKSRTTEARRLLRQMSDDGVSPLRRATADSALSLIGKVTYFWGGKSDAIGWDSRWNLPRIVTSPGAHDSGRMDSFGLDCSGFVSWALRNGADKCGTEVNIPEGTGKLWQFCREISWEEAEVGDLVFADHGSSEINHVGILVGRDSDGEWLMCHCDNDGVFLSLAEELTYVCSPNMFAEDTDTAD